MRGRIYISGPMSGIPRLNFPQQRMYESLLIAEHAQNEEKEKAA